ncbi:hypothetical protein PybrP1_001787 [[Pythium] brassicae (nom. inval.)]|nr:hypothetical protein PybrP1_001787 [[Pythium] brassicae (nom. inval.)]
MSMVLSAAADVRLPRREFRPAAPPASASGASSSSRKAGVGSAATSSTHKPRAASERFRDANDENAGARGNQLVANEKKSREAAAAAAAAAATTKTDDVGSGSASSSSTSPLEDEDDEEKQAAACDGDNNNDDSSHNGSVASASGDEADSGPLLAPAPPGSSRAAGRFSESAVPEKLDLQFVVPVRPQDFASTRSSLVSFEPSAKANDGTAGFPNGARPRPRGGGNGNCNGGGHNFVDFRAGDADAFQFLSVDDGESSRASNSLATPRSLVRANPYEGISIDVTSHSINSQGVVLYHVDIKGPEGLLSTYTIRRRYRAFKELHQKLQELIAEHAAGLGPGPDAAPRVDAFSADNVPDSPHTQARNHEKLQQIAEHSVLPASFAFPALPSGGVWSYLKRHDVRLVEQRKKRFEEILRIAIRHPATKTSAMLDSFLSVAPSLISQRGSSYTSLQDYSVPVFDRHRESIERKQLKLRRIEGRRQRTSSEASSSQS